MKTCVVYGDMSADKSSDAYPTVPVCDECVANNAAAGEESQIVSVGEFDPSLGDKCYFCDKTQEEEKEEQGL